MKPLLRAATAGIAITAAAVVVSPVARSVFSAAARQFPGLSAELVCLGIALCTWALLFAAAFWLVMQVPKSWHLAARAAAMLAVSCVLLTAGTLALLVPFFALNALCVTAKLCEVSVFAEAVNKAFTKHALHSPLPELLLVMPFLVGIAVALRNPYTRKTQRGAGRHAA